MNKKVFTIALISSLTVSACGSYVQRDEPSETKAALVIGGVLMVAGVVLFVREVSRAWDRGQCNSAADRISSAMQGEGEVSCGDLHAYSAACSARFSDVPSFDPPQQCRNLYSEWPQRAL